MRNYQRKEIIGDCTLYLADAFSLMRELGGFDALITDPPYAFDTQGAGKFRAARPNMDDIAAAQLDKGCDIGRFPMANYSAAIIFGHNDQWANWLPILRRNFARYAICAWHKSNPLPVANKHYRPDTEIYVHAWRRGAAPQGELADKARYIIAPNGKDKEIAHPTAKPLAIMSKLVGNAWGETVLDPFMGSGTTGIACLEKGKRFTGIEINSDFFDIACKRIERSVSRGLRQMGGSNGADKD